MVSRKNETGGSIIRACYTSTPGGVLFIKKCY
jgi:hypothetical protein